MDIFVNKVKESWIFVFDWNIIGYIIKKETKINENETFEYQVTHPRWKQLEVINNKSEIDFETVYGPEFAFIKELKPTSVFLAIGSKITIEDKRKI